MTATDPLTAITGLTEFWRDTLSQKSDVSMTKEAPNTNKVEIGVQRLKNNTNMFTDETPDQSITTLILMGTGVDLSTEEFSLAIILFREDCF